MKIPGVGDVKNKNVAIGAGVVGLIVVFAYFRKKKAVTNSTGATVDPNAIDPNTGIPYGQESGSGLDGSYYGGSVPNPYVTQTGTSSVGSGQTFTSNADWLASAEQVAVNQFGASYTLATTALGKYLAQAPAGLNPDEYLLVSEVVAAEGAPPVGIFRLIQALGAPPNPTPTPTPTPEPAPTPTPTPTPTPAPTPSPTQPSQIAVTVQRWPNPDSSYSGIASNHGYAAGGTALWRYNITSAGRSAIDIAKLTAQGPNLLYAGQTVFVPR